MILSPSDVKPISQVEYLVSVENNLTFTCICNVRMLLWRVLIAVVFNRWKLRDARTGIETSRECTMPETLSCSMALGATEEEEEGTVTEVGVVIAAMEAEVEAVVPVTWEVAMLTGAGATTAGEAMATRVRAVATVSISSMAALIKALLIKADIPVSSLLLSRFLCENVKTDLINLVQVSTLIIIHKVTAEQGVK